MRKYTLSRIHFKRNVEGGEAYYSGKLGEVTKTIKSMIRAETDIRTYIWEADSDCRSRANMMTYEDCEVVVSYGCDKGGGHQTLKRPCGGTSNNKFKTASQSSISILANPPSLVSLYTEGRSCPVCFITSTTWSNDTRWRPSENVE